jgi:transcription elongation factor Elf1
VEPTQHGQSRCDTLPASLPHNPVKFRVPPKCPFCGAVGTISPETTVQGNAVSVTWCCRTCGREWPITRAEQIQHPTDTSDR